MVVTQYNTARDNRGVECLPAEHLHTILSDRDKTVNMRPAPVHAHHTCLLELQTNLREKDPTWAFSWLMATNMVFTLKTLLRHCVNPL